MFYAGKTAYLLIGSKASGFKLKVLLMNLDSKVEIHNDQPILVSENLCDGLCRCCTWFPFGKRFMGETL